MTRGAAFQAGVPVDEVNGEFQFRAEQEPELPTRLTIDGTGVELHALGVDLEQGRARIELSEDGGNLLISNVSGTVFDGPISGEARIGLGRDQRFEASFQVAGASLALFRERQQAERAEESAAPELAAESAPRLSASEDRPGMLFGGVAISGIRGRPDLLRGRGIVRAIDNVAQVPIAQQVMQLVNLTWPFTGSLDFAEAEFFIAGRSLTFERILFESTVGDFAPLQLIGEGQLDLPSLELDTRFRSRGGWLIVRDVVGGIGDQLYVISVTGPLHDPQAAIIALPTLSAPNTERRWRQTAAVLGTGSTE